MPTLDCFAGEKLSQLTKNHQLRRLHVTDAPEGVYVERHGKRLVSFSGNDYFGLLQHPEVKAAAQSALECYGTGAGASRLVTGNHPSYHALEGRLARAKKKEASLIFGSGYLANLGVIPALVGKGDLVIADKLVHACMIDGAKLSGAKLLRFPHNNVEIFKELLITHRSQYRHCLVLTETVFSMDGDRAPLSALLQHCDTHDSWLLADDAHGLGIVPSIESPNILYIGTLSKGLGGYGGYVAASQVMVDYLASIARPFIFTTGLPPATIAAADAALQILEREPALVETALVRARQFTHALKLPEAQSLIVPVIIGKAEGAIKASEYLYHAGFLVSAIRPPTVPPGTSRLRFTFSSLHSKEVVEQVAKATAMILA